MSNEEESNGGPTEEEAGSKPEPKAKRTRTVWPIRIFVVESLSPLKLTMVAKSPGFNDADKASSWIKDNGDPSLTYVPARVGPGVSPVLVLREKSLFRSEVGDPAGDTTEG